MVKINYKDLFSHELEDLIKIKAQNQFVFSQTAADIAKSIQVIYENIFFSYLRDLQQKYDQTNLCLSGGCALNSLANGKIKNNTNFKKIFIPYEPADAGGSIGSALTKYYLLNQNKKKISTKSIFRNKISNPRYRKTFNFRRKKKNKIIFEKNR